MATYTKKGSVSSALELRFMIKTSMDEFNPEDRKLIRSHVMKGKNLGKMRPLGSRKHLHFICEQENRALSSSDDGASDRRSPSQILSSSPSHSETQICSQTVESIPPTIGSVASTMHFADNVKPATVEVVLQFSSIAKQLLFPMESCIFFDRRAENWIAPLAVDPAFLHANIFTTLYFFDAVLPGRPLRESQRTRHHYLKAVGLLRERLLCNDNDKRLSNNTVSIVLSFAGQAFCAGDLKSAINHIQGIHKIIDLRGGLNSITGNEKLINEILRCDLGIAVHSGSSPILSRDISSSHTYRIYPKLYAYLTPNSSNHSSKPSEYLTSLMLTHDIEIHPMLTAAWDAMSDFCSVINLAADSEQRIDMRTFLHSMASIMYNLLDMRFESSSWDETIRLGLLSFSCSVFLPWTRLGISYPHLQSILKNQFAGLGTNIPLVPPKLVVWLLMAGAVTIFDASDSAWIRDELYEAATSLGIESWSMMQNMLSSLMWIGIVHDKLGMRVFETAISCTSI